MDTDLGGYLLIGGTILVGRAIIYFSRYLQGLRTKAWKTAAAKLGLSYQNSPFLRYTFKDARIPDLAEGTLATNVISGTLEGDIQVLVADFSIRLRSIKDARGRTAQAQRSYHGLCALTIPDQSWPHFLLREKQPRREAFPASKEQANIAFPEDEAFSQAFTLWGKQPTETNAFFDAARRRACLAMKGKNFLIEACGSWLLIAYPSQIDPQQAHTTIEEALVILQFLK